MIVVTMTRYLLLLALIGFAMAVAAGPPVAGDEIADEAYVSWKAVIDKVSVAGMNGYRVKTKLYFRGRTSEGNQIRGTGKLRFVGEPNEIFEIGQQLRGNGSLKYWSTVKSMMGEDLVMIEGTGILDLATTDSVLPVEVAIEFKAALEIYNGG